eukprot:10543486-Heterocapsa_arctica.AAC.1
MGMVVVVVVEVVLLQHVPAALTHANASTRCRRRSPGARTALAHSNWKWVSRVQNCMFVKLVASPMYYTS